MKRDWYTAAELAELGLSELPSTKSGVIRRAAADAWASRPRQGRGGGCEYHVSALPPIARAELEQRALKAQLEVAGKLQVMRPYNRSAALARARVLDLLEARAAEWGQPIAKAIDTFVRVYNAGTLEVPEGLRDEIPSVTRRSLYRWRQRRADGGIAALADHYGNRAATGTIESRPELVNVLVGLLAAKPGIRPVRVVEILHVMHAELADEVTTQKVERWMHAFKAKNELAWTHYTNPDAAKSKFRPALGSASQGITRLNQVWELDSTPSDVMLKDGRHVVIGAIDVYSRRFKLLVAKTSKASAVALLVRNTILAWGVPEMVRTDNGQDYVSKRLTEFLLMLGIEHERCDPFESQQKPFIERAIGTFNHGLLELLDGYIGANVAQRKVIESRKTFAKRTADPEAVIEIQHTAEELQVFCDRWCEAVYATRVHSGLAGRSPVQVAQDWALPIRRIEDVRALDLLLEDGGESVIQKKGIRIDNRWYGAPEFGSRAHQRVTVRYDPQNVGRIVVWDEKGFVCEAVNLETDGLDRAELAAQAHADQKAFLAEQRAEYNARKRELADMSAEKLLERRVEAARTLPSPQAPSVPYTTTALELAASAVVGVEASRRDEPAPALPTAAARTLPAARRRAPESSVDLDERRKVIAEFEELLAQERAHGLSEEQRKRKNTLLTLPEIKAFVRRAPAAQPRIAVG